MVDSESPIKAWVRKHSPLKSRNKPLPPYPDAERTSSPIKSRVLGSVISGNACPTRPVTSTNKTAKRKLSSLLKHKSVDHAGTIYHLGSQTQLNGAAQDIRPASSASRREPVDELNERVSTLEAQLRAARAELASASTSTASAFRKASPWRPRAPHTRRAASAEVQVTTDHEVRERQARVLRGGLFDGVVESLLESDYKSASRRAAAYSNRGTRGSRRSVSGSGYEQAMADYRNLEDIRMHDDEDNTRRLARMRSELRAAEWLRIQEHVTNEQDQWSTGSKRSRSAVQQGPEERPARRQKQSNVDLRQKALPTLPRNRRAASEGHIPNITLREAPSAVPFIRSSGMPDATSAGLLGFSTTREDPSADIQTQRGQTTIEKEKNVTVYSADEDDGPDHPSPGRRHAASPSRLEAVNEEYEWDEDVF